LGPADRPLPAPRPLRLRLCLALLAAAPAALAAPGEAGAEAALARPGCRQALGLRADSSAAALLQADADLPARLAAEPACSGQAALERLERLEQALATSRERLAEQQSRIAAELQQQQALAQELAALRAEITGAPAAAPATAPQEAAAPVAFSHTPGSGFSLRSGDSLLRVWAEAKLLGFSSDRYVFNSGQPLIVSPKDPDVSFDLTAQQSTVGAAFQGPRLGAWTPGAYALFTLQDNILAEGYSFTPVVFYGDASNGGWRIAAGQQFDLFAPRDPDNLTTGKLATSGNPGSYRPQLRVERRAPLGNQTESLLQLGISSPITTALPDRIDLKRLKDEEIVEDNGWPNVEGRLSLGFGAPAERAGGRQLRPLELGVSGVVGQLRVLDNIRATDPLTLVADRSQVTVWGAALDGRLALGRHFGLSGELYTGQALGQYLAGILQTYNRRSNQAIPTSGGWAQVSAALTDSLRLNAGYGIDTAADTGRSGLTLNSTAFANLIWDVNPWLQLGLEGNYKLTNYDSFGDKDAWVVISQVLLRL
jgi:hypothetical protein